MKEITIDKTGNKPLYLQVFLQIKNEILQGRMKANEKLPSIRQLAATLEVNNDTIVQAYKLLEQEELVLSHRGKGTYVKSSDKELKEGGRRENNIIWDFANASPHPETFQVEEFKKIINEILDRDRGDTFTYQASEGYYPLRESIAQYLKKLSIKSNIHEIHIISGAQQGIDIVTKGLLELGDVVIIERPSYPGARKAFEARGAKLIEIPMEADGMNMDDLEKAMKRYLPKFIYVLPNFHNPTGISYSLKKRKRLLELAEQHDSIIIEDDYLSDFHFGYKKRIPLKALDELDRVIYIKSFSKIFMPGFRLGFLISPREYETRIIDAKQSADLFTMGLVQRSFDLIFRRGFWRKQLIKMEEYYRKGFYETVEGIKKYIPKEISYTIPQGTLYFWLKLPPGYHSQALFYEAMKRGIAITPGKEFFLEHKNSSYFRITYGNLKTQDILPGLEELGRLLSEFLKDFHRKDMENTSLPYY